jgi:hypothetical protein
MDVSRVSGREAEAHLNLKDWVGWRVGWMTGWYNPFDRYIDIVTSPVDIGRLVAIQGEYMQSQGRLVQEFGNKLAEFSKGIQTK